MRKAELIEENDSLYASPMACVLNPNGQLQVYIDFGMINRDISNDVYPMHQINEQLKAMAGATIFTTLDLKKGCH